MAGMLPHERPLENSVWRTDPLRPDPETLALASSVLEKGGAVVYPTETFYGLGAHPGKEDAVRRVYLLKGRDPGKPLPCIASDMAAVSGVVTAWPPEAGILARSFWPGPLTMILPVSACLPSIVHAGTGKIALRISSHPVARALAAGAGGLLVSTSANPAGEPPCLRVGGYSRGAARRRGRYSGRGRSSGRDAVHHCRFDLHAAPIGSGGACAVGKRRRIDSFAVSMKRPHGRRWS